MINGLKTDHGRDSRLHSSWRSLVGQEKSITSPSFFNKFRFVLGISFLLLLSGVGNAAQVPLYPTPAGVPDQVLIEVTIDNVEHVFLRLDTASPQTTMPAAQFSNLGLKAGPHQLRIGSKANGINVGEKIISELEATGTGAADLPDLPAGTIIRGTAGNDLWKGFAIGLDFKGRSLWLIPKSDGKPLNAKVFPHPQSVGVGRAFRAELTLAGPAEGPVLYVKAGVDKKIAQGDFLVDTGANSVLVQEPYWSRVTPVNSKSVPSDVTDFEGKVIQGAYRRAPGLLLDGHLIDGETVVWALPNFPVLVSEGLYFHHTTDGLIGLWAWYRNFTVLDFDLSGNATRSRILLFPYSGKISSVVDANFTGYGFLIKDDTGVVQVIKGSDAEKNGVRAGDLFLGGENAELKFGSGGFITGSLGEERVFYFSRGSARSSLRLRAERLP
jgi:hypothetical protein